MVLYNSTATASELMTNSTPEQIRSSMDAWLEWREEASKVAKVEFGLPLQAVANIATNGVVPSQNKASGYSMIEGEKEIIVDLLKSHPHLSRPGATIDLLELLPMSGL